MPAGTGQLRATASIKSKQRQDIWCLAKMSKHCYISKSRHALSQWNPLNWLAAIFIEVPCLWVNKWKASISKVASTSKSLLKDFFFSNQQCLQNQAFDLEEEYCTVVTSVRKKPCGWHHHGFVREGQALGKQERVRCQQKKRLGQQAGLWDLCRYQALVWFLFLLLSQIGLGYQLVFRKQT